ncbi:hypothetical protein LR48_Vigan10g099300 [Vigna angularis]|uniref:Cytokinin hydroxylase n=1 Tax=Phaseolus angularis TaxID=3914 RepID=A0A0L9VJ73_PHAAN|nr:Cytokinin hydroxylase [Vigna angularis]KOM55101.1 hypothetical protein LR48_Vigan10g099300 [Vigna angularis]
MEILGLPGTLAFFSFSPLLLLFRLTFSWWISPIYTHLKLKRCGFGGPPPTFPLGNIQEMKKKNTVTSVTSSLLPSNPTHDIHSTVFPYFSRWQNSHGKVFIYWLGTEPFLYIADPEFLKKMSTEAMASMMSESTNEMIERWIARINSGNSEIDVEKEVVETAGEIIAKTSFGMKGRNAKEVSEKLRALQMSLFRTTRYVGVPFEKCFNVMKTLEAKKLGKEIDQLLLSVITSRMKSIKRQTQEDLLGLLLQGNHQGDEKLGKTFTTRDLLDECKTFFFAGHETTALAISWTLLLLAMHEDWQNQLRDEIREVVGDKELDINVLAGLKKMKWVMNEVLRLYPTAPNVQRQAREDIQVDNLRIPNGTNMWIDVVAMHHDQALWGKDVNEFRPERFMNDVNGGCNHKMGYLPFGFGGRTCVGRNLSFMEYKIVLTLLLSRFSFKVSPGYNHSPSIMLSLRPTYGLHLLVQPLN